MRRIAQGNDGREHAKHVVDWQHQQHGLARCINHVGRQAGKLFNIGHDARFSQANTFRYTGRAARILEDRIVIGITVKRIQRHRRIMHRAILQSMGYGHVFDVQWAAHLLDVLQHEIHRRLLHR